MITEFVKKCDYCQRFNKQTQEYGHVPTKQVEHLYPWDKVCVDIICPWTVKINRFECQFRALTCIDFIICLPEVIPVENATLHTAAEAFKDQWLSIYPFPIRCLHENGNELLGPNFVHMLRENDIQSVPTTIKNPQANAIVERMHQLISTIAISLKENPPTSFEEVSILVQRKYMSAQFAQRTTVDTALKYSPGEFAFGGNILHPLSSQINWEDLMKETRDH